MLCDILFLYVPRRFEVNGTPKSFSHLSKQILVVNHINVYESILHGHFHSTVWSTCALESLALGVKNILMDIDGFATHYLKESLSDTETTRIVKTPEEFIAIADSWGRGDKQTIRNQSSYHFVPGFQKNIKKACQQIGIL